MTAEEFQALPLVKSVASAAGAVTGDVAFGETTIIVDAKQIRAVCAHLKSKENFERLVTVTAVDWYPQEPRYEIVYHLHSIKTNRRLRLKCKLASGEAIDSVMGVYRAADWFEREIFDLFGVTFNGHADLKRILMPNDWEGHPLRKDYPVHGHKYSYKDA